MTYNWLLWPSWRETVVLLVVAGLWAVLRRRTDG